MESESSRKSSSKKRKNSSVKFIPNLSQVSEATKGLPDAETWTEDNYISTIVDDGKKNMIEFTRKKITRGSSRPYRWIYEGKILIRNRDIPDSD